MSVGCSLSDDLVDGEVKIGDEARSQDFTPPENADDLVPLLLETTHLGERPAEASYVSHAGLGLTRDREP